MKPQKLFEAIPREQARMSDRSTYRRTVTEVLREYDELLDRHDTALGAVENFVREGNEWSILAKSATSGRARLQGVAVVLGKTAETNATPDHVAVCVIALRRDDEVSANRDRMVFQFANIASSDVPNFTRAKGYPFQDIETEIFYEVSPTTDELIDASRTVTEPGITNWLGLRRQLETVTETVDRFESNTAWVLRAADDTTMNAYLSSPTAN